MIHAFRLKHLSPTALSANSSGTNRPFSTLILFYPRLPRIPRLIVPQMTSDGVIVLLHDETMERTTTPWSEALTSHPHLGVLSPEDYESLRTTPVNELTFDQIRHLDIGRCVYHAALPSGRFWLLRFICVPVLLLRTAGKMHVGQGRRCVPFVKRWT